MKKIILFSSLLLLLTSAHAELKQLDNQQMQQVEGQTSAATINWQLSLNQNASGNFANGAGEYCNGANVKFCRLAISLNNRYHDGSYADRNGKLFKADGTVLATATGRKQWMVLKGIQGSINLQNIEIDGTDLLYKNDTNAEQIKAALQLSFKKTDPILIRNFGFNALAIETDTCTETNSNCSTGSVNIPGYLAMGSGGTGVTAYANGVYTDTTNKFDQGRETGFTGMMMNGNLALQGTLKVFSCDASMKRC